MQGGNRKNRTIVKLSIKTRQNKEDKQKQNSNGVAKRRARKKAAKKQKKTGKSR